MTTFLNITRRTVQMNTQGRGLTGDKGDKGDPGNLTGPASSVNENIPIFDGVTGDKLKDSGVKLSDKADVDSMADALALKADLAAIQIANRVYGGVDLTTKFATEIAEYADVWAWIKARITAVNYVGLNIGDYIPFTLGAETIWAQIAGIDTYYRTGNTELGHHIDFISKDCMATTYQWNTTDTNNGTANNAAPWMVSALKASLDGLVASLPAGLQTQIITKLSLCEIRYISGSTLTTSMGVSWNNIGKLWIPTEFEVFGSTTQATLVHSAIQAIQYPIFTGSYKNRIKGAGHNGRRTYWYLMSVYNGNSTSCCVADRDGYSNKYNASIAFRVPLCFRIG